LTLAKYKKSGVIKEAASRVGLSANVGLKYIAGAVAKRLGQTPPSTKARQWELLWAFVGETVPVSFRKPPRHHSKPKANAPDFLQSYEWRVLRMVVLKKHGARCQCCGASAKDGVVINVDHIKPRRNFPELALSESNLQVLCSACNQGKSNWDQTDWRGEAPVDTATVAVVVPAGPRLVKKRVVLGSLAVDEPDPRYS
jgi:5-methylcytosine-specific restriction endonuclease McrA